MKRKNEHTRPPPSPSQQNLSSPSPQIPYNYQLEQLVSQPLGNNNNSNSNAQPLSLSQFMSSLPEQTTKSRLSVNQNYLAVSQSVAEQPPAAASAVVGTASNADAARPMGELFIPLLKEIISVAENLDELNQTVEYNKEICRFMTTRVLIGQAAIKPLLSASPDNAFFSEGNYKNLQALRSIMGEIFTFVKNVSQVKGVSKIEKFKRLLSARSIEQSFRDLSGQLDTTLTIIQSAMNRDQQIAALATEIHKNEKIVKTVTSEGNASDDLEIVSTMAKVLSDADSNRHGNKSANKRLLDIINADPLKFDQYEPLRIQSVGDKHVSKWKRKPDNLEVAFREIRGCASPNDPDSQNFIKHIRREVTILRMLAKQPDVVMFHGITDSGAKTFLVTEWPTHGTLRNYYENSELFDWSKRIKFAFQISRALAYIQSANILHHDVRSDNVIITSHEQAKLANFGLSRFVRDSTKNVSRLREQVRYMAPEKLENERHRYDFKCEVYSFGVLLWEIAELTRPFGEDKELDICQMREVVKQTDTLPFTDESAPEKYREIAELAQVRDPVYRPDINHIMVVLSNLNESFENARAPSPLMTPLGLARAPSPLPLRDSQFMGSQQVHSLMDDEGNNVMTIESVVKQLNEGSSASQMKAFDMVKRYANLNHPKAKFHLAVYLLKMKDRNPNFSNTQMDVEFMHTDESLNSVNLNLLQLNVYMLTKVERQLYGCKLLKEAADSGHTDAQCRYATVLRNGNQALKPDIERAKYYLGKSAMSDHPSAYFYLAQIFETENMEQAIGYYKQAALKGHIKALEVLEMRGIKFS